VGLGLFEERPRHGAPLTTPRPRLPALVLAASLLASCSPPRPPPPPRGVAWSYEVSPSPDGSRLSIQATLAPGFSDELTVDDGADPFLDAPSLVTPQGLRPLARRGAAFVAPCALEGCTLRYTFRLRDAALALEDGDTALALADSTLAPPSTWLLHPPPAPGALYRLHVAAGGDTRFLTGVHPAGPGSYEAATEDLPLATYAAFGPLRLSRIDVAGAAIDLGVAEDPRALGDADLVAWARSSAALVGDYFGRFPVDRLALIVSRAGPGPTRGKTLGDGGAAIWLRVGDAVSASTVRDDWVLIHEMLHVGFPQIPRDHAWLAEGLASYIEPFLRARAGSLPPEKLWRDLLDGLPLGAPGPDDRGLVGNPSIDRIYWGGSLFCLLADLEIRQRTGGQRSLDDAVRAIFASAGSVEHRRPVDQILAEGDRATGTSVLTEFFQQMALRPASTDLPQLFRRLGVAASGASVTFDESAPLAPLRRSMTSKK